jgi:acyl-CoA reductase-like NAD-dependent aldehyde dehydrogenase
LVLHQRCTLETREDVMTLKNYVNGAFVPAWNGNVRSFHNPADNSQLGEVADSSIEDVDKAV